MEFSVVPQNKLEELTLKLGLCDLDTVYHCLRVGNIAKVLLEEYIRLYSPELDYTPRMLEWAAILHDIGKQSVDNRILLKTTRFTPDELTEMRQHVAYGEEILKQFPGKENPILRRLVHETVLYHHERPDGSGYLAGLTLEEIPLSAQIVALADCFDALVGARVYKPPMEVSVAEAMIREGKCGKFTDELISCLPVILHL